MSEYKVVPVEPTPEMVSAAEDAYMPFGDMELALRMAILAAPAVQGEPVAYLFPDEVGRTKIVLGKETAEHWCPPGESITPLYTAPQPTEQQSAPDASGLVVTLKSIEEWVMRYADPKHPVAKVARKALADYRKQGGEA